MSTQIKLTPQKKDGTLDSQHAIVLSGSRLPQKYSFHDGIPGIYYRTVLGKFVGRYCNIQRDMSFQWDILSDADYDYIMSDGILAAILRNSWAQFKIEILPATGNAKTDTLRKKINTISSDGIVYFGTDNMQAEYVSENSGSCYWTLKFTLTQVTPHILNQITNIQI